MSAAPHLSPHGYVAVLCGFYSMAAALHSACIIKFVHDLMVCKGSITVQYTSQYEYSTVDCRVTMYCQVCTWCQSIT